MSIPAFGLLSSMLGCPGKPYTETAAPPSGTEVPTGESESASESETETETEIETETGPSETDPTETGTPPGVPLRTCDPVVRYEGSASRVSFASEATGWDEPAWIPLTADGAGWSGTIEGLEPGIHCYKLIVDGVWMLDPAQPYRAYCDGVENSGLRVADCTGPALEVVSAGASGADFSASLQISAGIDGSAPASVSVVRRFDGAEDAAPAALDLDVGTITLDWAGLETGKYTAIVTVTDRAGRTSEPAVLPFWIEDGEPFVWQDAVMYMIMTDRFANADPSNDEAATPGVATGGDWAGGDLAGVTAAIEAGYFDDLGVRALWLTPFQTGAGGAEVASDGAHRVTGYHGYWPIDPRTVDPRLGTSEELKGMVAAAHRHGIRILMDAVVNHVHEDHPYVAEHPDWFNEGCLCGTAGCDWTAEALTCLFADYMPDIDWRNEQASEAFIADVLWWIEAYDLDGARIDAVKHVDSGAVFNLATRVRERFETAGTDYYLDGETAMGWSGDDLAANAEQYGTINAYLGPTGLDGQFDFVLYHAVVDNVFVHASKGMIHLDAWTGYSQTQYVSGSVMTPYFGSHDTSRLVSMIDYDGARAGHPEDVNDHKWIEDGLPEQPAEAEVYDRMRAASCWLFTIPGAPMLYQGDEYGEFGGNDPDNRHPHRTAGHSDLEAGLLGATQELGQARQALRALRRGAYAGVGSTEDVLLFARATPEGDVVIVGVNRAPYEATAWADLTGLGFADGLAGSSLSFGGGMVVSGGVGTVSVPARSCVVVVAP